MTSSGTSNQPGLFWCFIDAKVPYKYIYIYKCIWVPFLKGPNLRLNTLWSFPRSIQWYPAFALQAFLSRVVHWEEWFDRQTCCICDIYYLQYRFEGSFVFNCIVEEVRCKHLRNIELPLESTRNAWSIMNRCFCKTKCISSKSCTDQKGPKFYLQF